MNTTQPADFPIKVAALYQFTPFDDLVAIQRPLAAQCEALGVHGTLLLAAEGINGTIAGQPEAIDGAIEYIRSIPGCADIEVKYSHADTMPFRRMKVRLKKEIVTMGQPDLDPLGNVGTYVSPQDWNALIDDPETIVIDTRNDYEVGIGTFAGAIDPQTTAFREFPDWFRQKRAELEKDGKLPRVAMFCTGGIRCEKSTSFLRSEGVEEVYHLKGGILKYLETVPKEESRWQGDCFVFDERVSVRHGLEVGEYSLCRACRNPITDEEMRSDKYEEGVSCPNCFDVKTQEQRSRYAERQKQAELAKQREAARARG